MTCDVSRSGSTFVEPTDARQQHAVACLKLNTLYRKACEPFHGWVPTPRQWRRRHVLSFIWTCRSAWNQPEPLCVHVGMGEFTAVTRTGCRVCLVGVAEASPSCRGSTSGTRSTRTAAPG